MGIIFFDRVQSCLKTIHAKQFILCIGCFCHTICVLENHVTGFQHHGTALITHAFHTCKDKTRTDLIGFKTFVFLADKRHFVSCIDITEFSCDKIEDTFKSCDKHILAVGFTEKIIDL